MKTREARDLGIKLTEFVANGDFTRADELLLPVLSSKTSFALLDIIGKEIGKTPVELANTYLREIASGGTMGIGWILKIMGRYYPSIWTDWLEAQKDRPHNTLLMRKAVTFLPDDMKIRAQGYSK